MSVNSTTTNEFEVSVFNEWDPLEEVILGRVEHAQIAAPDLGLFAVEYREYEEPAKIPSGPYPQRIIEETQEDLQNLETELQRMGVIVRRPEVWDHSRRFATYDWQSDGQYNLCPRDLFLSIDNWLLEAPMTLRCRQHETLSFKPLLKRYLQAGARWCAAPRPRLADDAYNLNGSYPLALTDCEPVFDAANVMRLGRDLLYLVSDTGNRCGATWLQAILGDDFKVHICDNIYNGSHLDTTVAPIRQGLVVVNAERIGPENLPAVFRGWEVIYLDDVVDIGFTHASYASKWIGINLLMVRPDLAIVDGNQVALIRELERRGVDVMPLYIRHARTLGGGFHCVTLDVRRRGSLESYGD